MLTGRGRFIDDVAPPRSLALAFVRSPHAHAAIVEIGAQSALAVPGVFAVVTAADLAGDVRPLVPRLEASEFVSTETPPLAASEALFCGHAVAAVVAASPYAAADGRERVQVAYEPRPPIVSVEAGLAAGRVLARAAWSHGDVATAFATAAVVIRERFTHARCAPSPLEPRGLVADWDGETLTVWASTQTPSILRTALARALVLPEARLRVIVPDVGGGFGLKMHVFPEDVAVAAVARRLGRPVKWIEERHENLAAASQAREQTVELELAADGAGHLLALRARVLSDAGAFNIYPLTQALEPFGTAAILPGPYRTSAYAYEALAVATHKPPLGAYRGVGMTMGAFVMERGLDVLAARLGLDPADVRRRNFIPRDAYPFTSAGGFVYDSGDFPKAFEQALTAACYDDIRRAQRETPRHACAVGVGLACYTEYTGMGSGTYRRRGMTDVPGPEAATITIDPDGTVRCALSFPSQGQGHATALGQLVADRLGIRIEDVVVQAIDTEASPRGSGTFASRGAVSLVAGGQAAAEVLRHKIEALAAHLLEASADDIVVEDGCARVRGAGSKGVPLARIAALAYSPPPGGLAGIEPGLQATVYADLPGPTFSGGVHVALVEIDRATGTVKLTRYVVVEDCGPAINPMLVDGQIHGAVAQGIGEALLESVVYDNDGILQTATFMDYALPRASDVPPLQITHRATPSPLTPGGVKGMGEGGTIGAPAAIANAVADALGPSGVAITALPIRPALLAST